MEYVVLGLLMIQDLTVYQLNQAFNSGLSLIYSASYGSLLSALKKLLKLDEIEFHETVENGRNKKIYHINKKGITHFMQWMHNDLPTNKMEEVALSKVFFLGLVESIDEKKKILQNIVQTVAAVESELEQLSESLAQIELDDEARKIFDFQFKTLDYGVMAHRNGKEWFQQLLDELEK
ncbi:MAG: helix-turn-helix transcriptional regulator [Anaerolineaceae bacterium]|nr:helix-turn-helix transcriptional regulator [Anaerolineaceae bacterium]